MRDFAAALTWATLIPLSFWSAHIGVILWVWTALLAPNEMLFGFMHAMPLNKVATAVTITALVLNREFKSFYLDGALTILALLAASATLSALMAIGPEDALFPGNAHLYERFVKVLALAFLVAGVMDSRWRVNAVVVTICIAFGFNMVTDGLKFLATAGAHRVVGKTSVGDNNQLALAFLMTLPLVLHVMRYSAVRLTRIAFGALLAIGVIAVIGTFSRGGFIGLVVMALWLVAMSKRKVGGLLLVLAAACALYALAPDSYFARVDTINTADQDQSFMERVVAWKMSTLIALDRPFVGGGFWAVQQADVHAQYLPGLDALDFIKTPPPDAGARAAHSIYFEMLGDQGFMGLGLFLLLIGFSMVLCRRIKRAARQDPSKAWAGDLAAMLQVSLTVFCISGALVSMARFEALYILLALISRLHRIVLVEAQTIQVVKAQAEREPWPRPESAFAIPPAGSRGWRHRAARPLGR